MPLKPEDSAFAPKITFNWDQTNIDHIAAHEVTPIEAEQVVLNCPMDLDYELRNGEVRLTQVGETDAGRVLIVVTASSQPGRLRVVTAWTAKERLRRYFASHKRIGNAGRAKAKDIRE
jgi:uncharacterized protein